MERNGWPAATQVVNHKNRKMMQENFSNENKMLIVENPRKFELEIG